MALRGALGRRWSPVTRHFAWQAWHLVTSTFVLRGKRVTRRHPPCLHLGTAWRAWWHKETSTLSPPWFCVAGVALIALRGALGRRWSPVTPRHFAWQAWHLVTSTFVLSGRRGTRRHPPCLHLGSAWQAWHLWHAWSPLVAGAGDAALCAAGVALGDIYLRFTWQAWHNLTSTFVMRGKRGTYGTAWRAWSPLVACDAAALCVAGVALGDIHLRFAWQAWHKDTSTFVSRGTYGTAWRTWSPLVAGDAAALCVAGVAQGDIHIRFAWLRLRHVLCPDTFIASACFDMFDFLACLPTFFSRLSFLFTFAALLTCFLGPVLSSGMVTWCLYVPSCCMTQFIFVCLWWKTARTPLGISWLSRKSAMLFSMQAYKVCAQAFLSAVLAAGIVDSMWKDMPSR